MKPCGLGNCRFRTVSVALALLSFATVGQGCLLVGAVAAGAYASGKADEDRKAFHANNLEREKAGLKPLTKEEWLKQKSEEEAPPDSAKPASTSRHDDL
jgi:hypothetical protein